MDMKKLCLFCVVFVGMVLAASQAQARPLIIREQVFDDDLPLDPTRDDLLGDFDVQESSVAKIIGAAAEKLKMVVNRKTPYEEKVKIVTNRHQTPYEQLDEIDRLKLSIVRMMCEFTDEGCEDMQDAPMMKPEETFANIYPEDYVKVE